MDESEQLKYVTHGWGNIQFIKNPSEQIQLEATR